MKEMDPKKYSALLICLLVLLPLRGQTVFEEDFESFDPGFDLSLAGYLTSHTSAYDVSLSVSVTEDSTGRFARMAAVPNGAAEMMILKSVDVDPGKPYMFEVDTRGPFNRHVNVYSAGMKELYVSPDYKPATREEETEWRKFRLMFIPAESERMVHIGLYHYWSGTIDLDNIKVFETGRQSSYYVSSSEGLDENDGTKAAPFKSLGKISSITLFPGDSVLFKRGDRFAGHFVVNGSGSAGDPIHIVAYGDGARPIITGEVGAEGGGDHREAILVRNNDHMIFDGLEIQNDRLIRRVGVSDTDAFGIRIEATGSEIMHHFVLRNLVIRNVFAVQPILDREDFNSISVSGISFHTAKNLIAGQEKHIRNILVENSYFNNIQRLGIHLKHNGGDIGIGNDSVNRNMDIVIRNNEFHYNGGTGVLPVATYNCLIENNLFDHPGASTDPRMPGRGSAIWNYNSINTIMQYNMCLSARGYLDSHGIHIDNWNKNTVVQYNYMEDCEGGFVEILRGNTNAVYRFNISVNDGWRDNPDWNNSNHTIWLNAVNNSEPDLIAPSDSVYIYNNTIVIDSAFTTSIDMDGKHMFVYNNIFSATGGGGIGTKQTVIKDNGTPFVMSNNLFEGEVYTDFTVHDVEPSSGDPFFTDTSENQFAYQIMENSPVIRKGSGIIGPPLVNAGYGVFRDIPVYPEVDFFGNPIGPDSLNPNIGACNLYNQEDTLPNGPVDTTIIDPGDTTSLLVFETGGRINLLIYPQPSELRIHVIANNLSGPTEISIYDLQGKLLHEERRKLYSSDKRFELKLDEQLPGGIYILSIQTGENIQTRKFLYH